MQWLAENWFWVLIIAALLAVHLFGHGGHGGKKGPDKPSDHRH